MSSENNTSPIIITSPGSTRIFRNDSDKKNSNSRKNKIIRKKSLCCRYCGCMFVVIVEFQKKDFFFLFLVYFTLFL